MKQYLSNFNSNPLTCDPALFSGKNISNIAESNGIFPGKEEERKTSTIFRRKRGVKVGPKTLTLGLSLFHKYWNPSKKFQTVFLFARVIPLVRILAILNHIGGVRAKKPSKKGYFEDADSVRKTLKIFNLTANETDETYHDYVRSSECKPKSCQCVKFIFLA